MPAIETRMPRPGEDGYWAPVRCTCGYCEDQWLYEFFPISMDEFLDPDSDTWECGSDAMSWRPPEDEYVTLNFDLEALEAAPYDCSTATVGGAVK